MDLQEHFISSLDLERHPMRNVKPKLKAQYYFMLEYFLERVGMGELERMKLEQYKKMLFKTEGQYERGNVDALIDMMISCPCQPWRRKYRYGIICDVALITLDFKKVERVADIIKSRVGETQRWEIIKLVRALNGGVLAEETHPFTENLLGQYRKNKNFFNQKEMKIIVTANMSAGKSTLINALVGRAVARTSQEVCTGNACYIYNKPFEDGHVHLQTSNLTLDATEAELSSYEWNDAVYVALYFQGLGGSANRVCMIDTPGVNSAVYKAHRKISREQLKGGQYDILLHILNGNKLGTDEELSHLRWIYNNISSDKIIFVLNKLDNFRKGEDSIQASLDGVRKDLVAIEYKDPIICPLSAYFAYLLKKKRYGGTLTEDEEDEYELYFKKFKKDEYDLSRYGTCVDSCLDADEYDTMDKRCGIYNLEKILSAYSL